MSLPWSENYSRAYKVTVGTRDYIASDYTQAASVIKPKKVLSTGERVIPGNARVMSNIVSEGYDPRGFTFRLNTVQKVSEKASEAETTQLDLYNIDNDLIQVINHDKCIVIVEAGYQDKVELAYTGDVRRVEVFRQGTDVIHRLHCGSGAIAMRNTIATLSYDEALSAEDIMVDMVGRLPGTALGTYGLSQLKDEKKTGGRGFTGNLITNIDRMASEYNLNYAHFNGKIVIIPYRMIGQDYTTFSRTNYNLPPEILKKVSDVSDKKNKGTTDTKSKLRKLQVNTFFIPIDLGQFITIPNTEYTKEAFGTYQVKGRRVILESTGNAWDVVLEVDELEQ